MSDHSEEVYGPDRAERLLAMLRALAERIQTLDRTGGLLERAPELQKLLGNARSELFHYEVRVTYDTPEIAEGRRIVDEAERRARDAAAGFEGDGDDESWRRGRDERNGSIFCSWRVAGSGVGGPVSYPRATALPRGPGRRRPDARRV